ncbi:unnamed protein product, partial [Nesidiocoris tenuis]
GVRETLLHHLNNINPAGRFALVIDGQSLKFTLMPDLKQDFLHLCLSCKSVICCRVSPMQKAEVRNEYGTSTSGTIMRVAGFLIKFSSQFPGG